MFDTAKIQRMTTELENFAREHEDIYLIPEWLKPEAFALFRRMRITIRAVLTDSPQLAAQREIFGCPLMPLAEAIKNFTPQTGIILLSAKPQPNPLTAVSFTLGNQQLNVPTFAVAADEALALYDRLTLMRTLQQYREDGVFTQSKDLAMRFARGLTTFLDSRYQNFKFQLWDSREYFKPRYDFDDTAIVIQGPIAYDNNYTVETFKLYRSIYPNAPLVVSTWRGEANDAFRRECENNSVVLLENEPPPLPDPWHINFQRISSFQGIRYVQENTSAKFVLKCRTDQRINQFDFLDHFKNLLKIFPPNNDKLLGRIIALDYWKLLPFHVRDFFAFGYIADVLKLYVPSNNHYMNDLTYSYNHGSRWEKIKWKIFRLSRSKLNWEFPTEQTPKLKMFNKMMNRWVPPEIFIMKTFCQKYIMPVDETKLLEISLKFIRDCLILLESSAILFDWSKYEGNDRYCVLNNVNWQSSFNHWLDVYQNFKADWI